MRATRGLDVDAHVCRTSQPATRPVGEEPRSLFPAVKANGALGGRSTGMPSPPWSRPRPRRAGSTRPGSAATASGPGSSPRRSAPAPMRTPSCARQGINHRDPKTLEIYARESAPLVGNAVTQVGL